MFWVISVYFNVRYILPKSGTFPPGHPVCIYIYYFEKNTLVFISSIRIFADVICDDRFKRGIRGAQGVTDMITGVC